MYKQLHSMLLAMSQDQQLDLLAGGSIGIEKECLRVDKKWQLIATTASCILGFCTNQSLYYYGFFWSVIRTDYTSRARRLRGVGVFAKNPSVCLFTTWRWIALECQHAMRSCRWRGDSDCAIWLFKFRHDEDSVSSRLGASLWKNDASYCRRTF